MVVAIVVEGGVVDTILKRARLADWAAGLAEPLPGWRRAAAAAAASNKSESSAAFPLGPFSPVIYL